MMCCVYIYARDETVAELVNLVIRDALKWSDFLIFTRMESIIVEALSMFKE